MITTTAESNQRPLDAKVQRAGYGDVHFTIDDALEMVQHQILPEDISIELLDGRLVYRDRFDLVGGVVTGGHKHTYAILAIAELGKSLNNSNRHLSTQYQLECTKWHVPIADAVVTRGSFESWREELPTAADAHCVVEVAYSSYERDSGEKLVGYAKAGIPQYIIINLRNRTAEVYTNPDQAAGTYPPAAIITDQQQLSMRVGDEEFFAVELASLLP